MNWKLLARSLVAMLVSFVLVLVFWQTSQAKPTVLKSSYVHPLMTLSCEGVAAGQSVDDRALTRAQPNYQPKQTIALADPTNFGERYGRDVRGWLVDNQPIIVLHETVGSTAGTINFFRTPHPNDNDQASYHSLISLNGTIYYIVPPENRAYGAGNSIFKGGKGEETVKTNPKLSPSVNNFAYHISLETPASGMHNGRWHEGYTDAQYQSLAWLVAKTGVEDDRITTHKAVDRSGSRMDPRSFDWTKFRTLLNTYNRQDEIGLTCLTQLAEKTKLPHFTPDANEASE